ncbi:459_t:CDS:2 [Paraglomus brasilianum]|uniref:459_t:CDS:1 n=1 Tax=Paraglomus brasilianum TaxID=144538 RepID=A0A9N9AN74_9GLOM|nr:459_t:CDS:2 [Paraglomus brasilianum]
MHHCRSTKMMTYQANDITSAHSNSTTSKAAASSHTPSPSLNTFQLPANTDDGCNNTKTYCDSLHNTYISPGDRFWHLGQWITKGDSVLVIDASSGRDENLNEVDVEALKRKIEREVVVQKPDGSRTRINKNLLGEGKIQIHLKAS